MKLAFCLFKYFPFGGMQRDFFRIADACARRGHEIHVLTRSWEGDKPDWLNLHRLPVKAISNSGKDRQFYQLAQQTLQEIQAAQVIGFNKMPGLDVYFAADPCYAAKVNAAGKGALYRLTPRYRHFSRFEQRLFTNTESTNTAPHFFVLTDRQAEDYQAYYGTPAQQFHKVPPGIARDRQADSNAEQLRKDFRQEFSIADDEHVLLLLGSGFRTKGLDRAIAALASLPAEQREKTHLFVVGKDRSSAFEQQAKELGIASQVRFFAGRDDVPRFLQGADILIHPAYSEAAGMVLLEAIVAGLPVLVTDVCGFAHYINDAEAGIVESSPFDAGHFARELAAMLNSPERRAQWRDNGIRFGQSADIYDMPDRAAALIEQFAGEKQR